MKVYRAETGQYINWHQKSNLIQTLDDLKQELEHDSGVPTSEQILMTSFGDVVRPETLRQVMESKGKDEYIIICYDRRYLSAREEDIQALLDAETPPLEPKIALLDGALALRQLHMAIKKASLSETCSQFISLFAHFDSYSQSLIKATTAHAQLSKTIVEEQKSQSMALNVAIKNLEKHRKNSEICIQQFVSTSERELHRQQALLSSVDNDLVILKHVRVHPAIAKILEPSNQGKRRLLDFLDVGHVDLVRADTVELCEFLSFHIKVLKQEMVNLAADEKEFHLGVAENMNLHDLDGTLSDIQALQLKTKYLRDKTKRDLRRIAEKISTMLNKPISALFESLSLNEQPSMMESTSSSSSSQRFESSFSVKPTSTTRGPSDIPSSAKRTFDAFTHLTEIHVKDYLPKMANYEGVVRQKTCELVMSKRKSISTFIRNMAVVSQFQRHVGTIKPTVDEHTQYLIDFKEKYNGRDLESIRDILFGYGAIMIELVRRKEYATLLVSNSKLIANVLSQYRTEEENRREHFRQKITKSLPFKLTITDKASPQCEISVNGVNSDEHTELEKKDISDFMSIITQVYSQSPQLADSMRKLSLADKTASESSSKTTSKLTSKAFPDEERFLEILQTMINEMNSMGFEFLMSVKDNLFNNAQQHPQLLIESIKNEEPSLQVSVTKQPTREARNKKASLEIASSNLDTSTSSAFSVVDDDKKMIMENKELQAKLETAEEDIVSLEQKNQEQAEEIAQLRDIIKNLESEKEEFESHRQSFLNELKNKDKSADFRIASAEEDFQAKINDLQYELEEERRMKKNLEIEHASELNTLQSEHTAKVEQLNYIIEQEKKTVTDTKNEQLELHRRLDQVREDLSAVKDKLENERTTYENQLSQLQTEIEEKEKTIDRIKMLQQQTRNMVNRAQEDWESKNEELKSIKRQQEAVEAAVRDLLYRFKPSDPSLKDYSLDKYVKSFKENLESFIKEYDITKGNLNEVTQELVEVTELNKNLIDAHNEWRSIASGMAEQLEEYRRNVIFEIVNQLQLPMDEEELKVLQTKVTPSDDDTAIWNQILQLCSSINTQKFVLRVNKRVRDNYDLAKQYKKEYRSIKDKYNKLCATYCEKIAFRNFQVGDVALFLPTRNSTGKPWAAFNINAPHYFLQGTDNMAAQMESREWIVARIVSITEHTTKTNDPESNPFGLGEDTKFYLVEAENWRHNKHHPNKKRHIQHDSGLASIPIPAENVILDPHHQQLQQRRSSFGTIGSSSSSNFVHSYTASLSK